MLIIRHGFSILPFFKYHKVYPGAFCYTLSMSQPITYTTNHKYRIVPYSPEWPEWFTKEAKTLKDIFGSAALSIDHVGSTAIPGMSAKPQLDILVQMKDAGEADACNEALADAGYKAYGDVLGKGGRLFSRWEHGEKAVNLHVYPPGSPAVGEYINVRDYLISHPIEAKDYAALKMELFQKYPDDYLKYREYKDPYIDAMKGRITG